MPIMNSPPKTKKIPIHGMYIPVCFFPILILILMVVNMYGSGLVWLIELSNRLRRACQASSIDLTNEASYQYRDLHQFLRNSSFIYVCT